MTRLDTTADRTAQLILIVDHWWHLIGTTRHKLEILQALIRRANLDFEFRNGGAGDSINLLAHTLLFDIIKDLSALTIDRDKNAPSLSSIIGMLGDAHVILALKLQPAAPDDFDRVMSAALEKGRSILLREVASKINAAADRSIVRLEIEMRRGIRSLYNLAEAMVTWSDPNELLSELESIGSDLAMLVLGRHFDAHARTARVRHSSHELWRDPVDEPHGDFED